MGLSVAEIRAALATLPANPAATDWHALAAHLVDEAERRIGLLQQTLADITGAEKLCDLHLRATEPVSGLETHRR